MTLCACGPVEDERDIPTSAIRLGHPERFTKRDTPTRLGFNDNPHGGGAHGQAGIDFDYDKPDHWEVQATSQFRLINLRIPGGEGDPAECYLSLLPGSPEFQNIQRWATQMGQSIEPDAAAKLPTAKLFGRDARVVEFHGTHQGKSDYTLLGLVLSAPSQLVTLKMIGPKALVAAERDNFFKLAASLRLKDMGSAGGTEAADGPKGSLAWTLPTGWVQGPTKPMREATLQPGPDAKSECTLIFLSGSAGGRDANIQRWAGQMGATSPTGSEIERMPTLQVLGQTVTFAEITGHYTGMGDASIQKAVMFGVVCPLPGRTLFIKMVGPEAEMTAARQGFLELCRSLKLEGGK